MLISIILKLAYKITKNHPLLWFFGLFLVGGVNIFLIKLVGTSDLFHLNSLPTFSNNQVLVALFLIVILLVLGNIARIALITFSLIKLKSEFEYITDEFKVMFSELDFYQNQGSFWKIFLLKMKSRLLATVAASILANIFLFLALIVVFAPQVLFFTISGQAQSLFVFIFLFLPLALVGLYINMMTPLFIVVLGYNFASSIRLAYDLLTKRFSIIVSIIFILGALYSSLSILGLLIAGQISLVLGFGLGYGLLIFILGILNAFCHVSLLILFLFLVRPIDNQQDSKLILTKPILGQNR